MRRSCLLVSVAFLSVACCEEIGESQFVRIPDEALRTYLVENFDTDADGCISYGEAQAVKKIACFTEKVISSDDPYWDETLGKWITTSYLQAVGIGVRSLEGLENFTALESLDIYDNEVENIDPALFPNLLFLNCTSTEISEIDVIRNPLLTSLGCGRTGVAALDVSHNPALVDLHFPDTQVSAIDLGHNPKLVILNCSGTNITELDLSRNPELGGLICSKTDLTAIDLSHNPKLYSLYCRGTKIASLDLSNNPELKNVDCSETNITELDVSHNLKLRLLVCENNPNLKRVIMAEGQEIGSVTLPDGVEIVRK